MMPLSEILFLVIIFVVLYRFVFNFLLPVVRTTRQVRQQFRNMQDTASNVHSQGPQPKKKDPSPDTNKMGEYIDFEEVK